jgi:hypothetical protein
MRCDAVRVLTIGISPVGERAWQAAGDILDSLAVSTVGKSTGGRE